VGDEHAKVRLPREVRVLVVGTLVNRAGTFVEPFLVLYLTAQRGFTAVQAGLVLAAYGLGALASQLVGGWATDHLGRRTTLIGSLLLSGASLLALGAARGTVAITLAAVLVGLLGDMYRPASQALIADVVSPEQRPVAFSALFWAVNLGFAVAALSAGFAAEHGYWILFVVDAVTCALYAVVVAIGIRRDPPRAVHTGDGPSPGFRTAVRDTTFMALVGFTVLQAVAYFQCFLVLPLVVVSAGLGPSAYGVVAATNGLVIVALQPFTARRLARYDRSWLLAASLAVCALGFLLQTWATTLPAFVACAVVWTLGEIGSAGVLPSIVTDLASPVARGRYMGLFGFSFGSAAFLAPLVGPPLYQAAGPGAVWALSATLFLVAAAGNLRLRRTVLARRMAHVGPVAVP
jgi:MFS family permease